MLLSILAPFLIIILSRDIAKIDKELEELNKPVTYYEYKENVMSGGSFKRRKH